MASKSLSIVEKILSEVETKVESSDDSKESSPNIKSRHFIDSHAECINDCIDGAFIASATNNTTRLFTSDKSVKVVLRSVFDKSSQVALISGGGSGHEPSHAGFVGKGMLTAAVCGEIFASPPTKAIVAAIRAVGGPKGVLLIVKNYTGDVLNFSLAASIAKEKYGIQCETIIIGDDCAIGRDRAGMVGRRGIAGTVFIHKIAGYLAETGHSLNDIKAFLEKNVVQNLGSIGVAATSCYLPGSGMVHSERINSDELELGLGIHGESGAMTLKFSALGDLIPKMFDILYDTNSDRDYIRFLHDDKQRDIAVLINNLGGTTPIEMGIIQKHVLLYLNNDKTYNFNVQRVFCGSYMTSLAMHGFSISIMAVNDPIIKALDFAVAPIAWIPGTFPDFKSLINGGQSMEELLGGNNDIDNDSDQKMGDDDVVLSEEGAGTLRSFIENACGAMEGAKEELNALDVRVGDGDCGSTLDFGRELVMKRMDGFDFKNLCKTLQDLGETLADMGGSSGALYGYLFISAAKRIKEQCGGNGGVNGLTVSTALKSAVSDLSGYSRAKQGNRTMMDALIPAVKAAKEYFEGNPNGNVNDALKLVATKAHEGAEATKKMTPAFGRSCYVPIEVLNDAADPGAVAVSLWIRALVGK